MTETNKTADKCAKCGVTNPLTFSKCRRCGKNLQWATAEADSASNFDAAAMPNVTQAMPDAQSSTRLSGSLHAKPPVSAATNAFKNANASANVTDKAAPNGKVPLAGFVDELASGANRPAQIYAGGPPRARDDAPTAPPKNLAPLYASGVLGTLVVLFLLFRLISPRPVAAISDFEMHTTKGQTFQSWAPKDAAWELHEGAREDGLSGGSRWLNASAKINIAADQAGSFMSEGMKRGDKTPQQTLHEMAVRRMSEEYGDYSEKLSQKYSGGFGETWRCEFSGQGGARAGRLHGLRATMLSNQNRIQFIATCREADWDKLKPGFEKILNSISAPGAPLPEVSSPTTPDLNAAPPSDSAPN